MDIAVFTFPFPDPCEYNNLAHSKLDIVHRLLQKLVKYQKKALPVWFPERDPTANPAEHHGYWGPWMSSKANQVILKKVVDDISKISEKKHHAGHRANNGEKIGKVFSTHATNDTEVYHMLNEILRKVEGKKGRIPQTNGTLMKESLAMLYAKMKQKTRVDDLMHKLQMIKKGRVAKSKAHRSGKARSKSEALSSTYSDSKLFHMKGHKVDRNGAKRGDIENTASNQDNFIANDVEDSLDENHLLGDEEQGEYASSLDASSDSEKLEQSDFKSGELTKEADMSEDVRNSNSRIEGESNPEDESSADITSEMSAPGSGSEFQEGNDVIDDANDDN